MDSAALPLGLQQLVSHEGVGDALVAEGGGCCCHGSIGQGGKEAIPIGRMLTRDLCSLFTSTPSASHFEFAYVLAEVVNMGADRLPSGYMG